MDRRRKDGGDRDPARTWIAIGLSLLVLASLPLLVWGHAIRNVACLGIAGALLVGAAYALAVKYLEQRVGDRVGARTQAKRGPASDS